MDTGPLIGKVSILEGALLQGLPHENMGSGLALQAKHD
jgi:hypothetical protein